MLGKQENNSDLFQYVAVEDLVPADHFLRRLRAVLDLTSVIAKVTDRYSKLGRPSYDPTVVACIWVLQHLYGFSERQICDEIGMHAGFRWFCGLSFNDQVPDQSTLVKLRTQKWEGTEFWRELLDETVRACEAAGICKPDRMGVDGTLITANAAFVSLEEIPPTLTISGAAQPAPEPPASGNGADTQYEPGERSLLPACEQPAPEQAPPSLTVEKGGRVHGKHKSGDPNWHGEHFSNATHRSTTDPEARLYRKGKNCETKLRFMGHYMADLTSRVIYDAMATQATGTAECQATIAMLDRLKVRPAELAADLAYRHGDFLADVIERGVQPLVAIGDEALEPEPTYKKRTYNLVEYAKRRQKLRAAQARNQTRLASRGRRGVRAMRQRTRLEHLFAEAKVQHGMDRANGRGISRVDQQVKITAAVQNLKRLIDATRRRRRPAQACDQPGGWIAGIFSVSRRRKRAVRGNLHRSRPRSG
jgi:transposase